MAGFAVIQLPAPPDHIPDGERRDTLYTVAQVAQLLGRSKPYVTKRIRDGVLAGVREGGRVVVRSRDLEAYISSLPAVGRRQAVTVAPVVPLQRERGRKRSK